MSRGRDCQVADSYQWAFCGDPGCGLHLIAFRNDVGAVIEVVMSPEQTLELIESCKTYLYEKATLKKE